MVIDPTFRAAIIRFARLIFTAFLSVFVLSIYASITHDPNANLTQTLGQAIVFGLTAAISAAMEWLRAYLTANNIPIPQPAPTPTLATKAVLALKPRKTWADYMPI